MNKNHSFNIDDAVNHGIEKAILLHNMRHWLDKNKANDSNDYDGFIWTYNTTKAFGELFPYMKQKSISRWLNELEKDGIVKSSKEYNKMKFDRTKWYTIPSEYNTISQNEERDSQNEKRYSQNEETIPNINTNINTYKKDTKKAEIEEQFESFWSDYPRRIAKANAKKSFERALKKATFDEIMRGVFRSEALKNDPKYIPHPATWLNQERWTDEVTDKPKLDIGDIF